MTFLPAQAAPWMAMEEAISSSIWMNTPPTSGMRLAKRSTTSVDGVIGIAGDEAATGGERALAGGVVAVDEVGSGQDSLGIGVQVLLRCGFADPGSGDERSAWCWPGGASRGP